MRGWRDLVDGFRTAVGYGEAPRAAPTAPFGDTDDPAGRPRLPGLGDQDPFVRDVMLARIRARDPGFDAAAFLRGAVDAFTAVERAWSERDPQRSRQYLKGSLWASHRARLELYALHDRWNRLDGLTVRSASIAGAECGGGLDRITVRIAARSSDYDVDAAGNILRGDRTAFDWEEDWTLERAGTSTTPKDGGVLAQRCPGCGAPLQVNDDGCCATCGVPVMDGSRDWVVVGVERCDEEARQLQRVLGVSTVTEPDSRGRPVTQTVVVPLPTLSGAPVTQAPAHDPDALAVLRAADADFVPGDLTDHARNAFTALRQAWAAMDATRARPYLAEPAFEALTTSIEDVRGQGLHRLADDPLVESVRIAEATDVDGFLTVVCAVTAEMVDADADAGGTVVRGTAGLQHRSCLLTFRRHDLARSPGSGINVLRCPRCGAPLRATVLEPCPYCRQAVADGGGEWTMTDVGPLTEPALAPDTTGSVPVAPRPPAPLAELTAVDPTVNPFELLAQAREAFFAVEASSARLDPDAVAGLLTPRALALHVDRLGRLRSEGRRLRMAFLDLTGAAITGGSILPDRTMRATVRFRIGGEVAEMDAAGAVVAGSGGAAAWDEEWDLLRAGPGAPWLVDAMRVPAGGAQPAPLVGDPTAAPVPAEG